MPKFITVPSPIALTEPASGDEIKDLKPVTLGQFIRNCLLADARWSNDLEWLRSKSEITAAIKDQVDLPSLKLRTDDHEKLAQVARKPQNGYQGYHPAVLDQLLAMIEAVVGASDSEPVASAKA